MTVMFVCLLLAVAVVLWPGRAGPWVDEGMADTAASHPLVQRAREVLGREVSLRRPARGWVADFAELSAVGLDAGLAPTEAARLACDVGGEGQPAFAELGSRIAEVDAQGGSVGTCLEEGARDSPSGDADLAFLAVAWQLTEEFGVAAAPAARTTAEVLRERAAADDRRSVLAAGPKASMWLLTLLPASGPLVAMVLGLPVGEVYGGGAALLAAAVGLALTVGGWCWSRALLARALRPAEIT